MVVDHVATGDAAFFPFRRVGQGPHAGVGEEDLLAGETGLRDEVVRLVQEVVDLVVVGDHAVEIPFVTDIGGPDQITAVPRVDEVRTAVLSGLDVEGLPLRRAGEGVHYDVAALGASYHPTRRVAHALQHLVYPGTGHVHRDGGARRVTAAVQDIRELHAGHGSALDDHTLHPGVGKDGGAVLGGRDGGLDGEALGVLDLGVVVEGRGPEAL